jgi:hypothetical protein
VSWRKTLILALILALMGGFYLWDRNRIQKGKAVEDEQKKLFPWTADQVSELSVQRGPEPLRLVRDDKGAWRVVEPVQAAGDQDQIKMFLERLLRAKRERKIADEPGDLAPYGLDKPLFTITVKAGELEAKRVLALGAKNPTEVFFYAQIQGEKGVFLVSDTVRRDANKDVFELRDKTLWAVAADRVQAIRIGSAQQDVALEKDPDGQWRIAGPRSFPADGNAVQSLLFRLSRLRAAAFEDNPERPLAELGLDPPQQRVAVRLKDPDEEKALQLGAEAPGEGKEPGKGRRYARVEGGGGVVLLQSTEVGDLSAAPDAWRVRSLMAFDRDKVRSWEIRRADGVVAGRKVDKGNWEMEKPERFAADSLKVNDLLWAIKDARVSRFLDGEEPLVSWDRPQAEVSIWVEDAPEPLKLVLGGSTPDDQGVYAKAPGQEGVVVVDKKLGQELRVSAHDLRDKRFVSFDLPAVRRLQVSWEDKTLEMTRRGENWKLQAPREGELEAARAQGLLWTLREARFEEIVGQPPDAATTGQGAPRLRAIVWGEAKEPLAVLRVGKAAPDRPGMAFAWGKGDSPAYLVAEKLLEDVIQDARAVLPDLTGGGAKR